MSKFYWCGLNTSTTASLAADGGLACAPSPTLGLLKHLVVDQLTNERERSVVHEVTEDDSSTARSSLEANPLRVARDEQSRTRCYRRRRPSDSGRVYCAAVLDVCARRIVGWSIADHIRSELVVDALQMACWNRQPQPGTILHSDRGSVYTSWIFGHRLREAGLLGSMGRVASSVDNTMMESFWSTRQRELLDRQQWATRADLASAIFEWIEGFCNPVRRHTSINGLSLVEFEALHNRGCAAA